jgi:tRNA pseudouridine55 synthase
MTNFPNGGLLLDKPAGMTSHDVVALTRRFLGTKRVGHTGTLDPFATGLMVICVGNCTRLSRFLTDKSKTYRATMRFGFATDTQDHTGAPLSQPRPTQGLTEAKLREVAAGFVGPQMQMPPMFSAKKIDGVALHHLARLGKVVVRAAVPVTVHNLEFLPDDDGKLIRADNHGTPIVDCEVTCSAGTYIRTLAHDIGEKLGCGAHLIALRRTAVDGFTVDDAVTLEELQRLAIGGAALSRLIPPLSLLRDWTHVTIDGEEERKFLHGQPFNPSAELVEEAGPADEANLAVLDARGEMLGVARFARHDGLLRPQIVFPPPT